MGNVLALICSVCPVALFFFSADNTNSGIGIFFIFLPSSLLVGVGAIFSWIGFFLKKPWAALVGAILYCVGSYVFKFYGILMFAPLIVLGFIGYSNQLKIQLKNRTTER